MRQENVYKTVKDLTKFSGAFTTSSWSDSKA